MRTAKNPGPEATRRTLLKGLAAMAIAGPVPAALAAERRYATIPGSGERVPAVGMGTWITFNVSAHSAERRQRVAVLRTFFDLGGGMVDSSPMYGLSESTLGYCLEEIGGQPPLFAATKVWTPTRVAGVAQMNRSAQLWGQPGFDLMQVHNMVDWQAHLKTLRVWRDEEKIRYIGITTSHGRRHAAMERVIEGEPDFEFVQFTYNIADREAEKRLLPAAAANGKAVIINRPFRRGQLFDRVAGQALPEWAAEIGCETWAQFFLKFVISHPAVTCAIPATTRVDHMQENMAAATGVMPDEAMRRRMADYFASL